MEWKMTTLFLAATALTFSCCVSYIIRDLKRFYTSKGQEHVEHKKWAIMQTGAL